MRVLAGSDIHGNYDVYTWLVRLANERDVDALILAGDLLGCPDGFDTIEDAQRHDAANIVRILEETKAPVYYIMGNDDLVELDPGSDQIRSLHGCRVEAGRMNLVGYQYSLPFMGGVYEKPENEIADDLRELEPLVDCNTVLITHSPAYGILDLGVLDNHAGSVSILDLARRRNVRAHIHGHIHSCFGRVDRHFNVAAGGRPRAMIVDFESFNSEVVKGTEENTRDEL